jgi:hypothetical protein
LKLCMNVKVPGAPSLLASPLRPVISKGPDKCHTVPLVSPVNVVHTSRTLIRR